MRFSSFIVIVCYSTLTHRIIVVETVIKKKKKKKKMDIFLYLYLSLLRVRYVVFSY